MWVVCPNAGVLATPQCTNLRSDPVYAKGREKGAGIKARMFIHQRCGRLAETLPAMQHDPNRREDVLKVDADQDGVGGDDAVGALRYLGATKSRGVTQRKLRGL